ncbi:hypothetical protein AB0M29_38165 [Streptomyces sp. NPDC051976]|uniref:hypothetical protein n=1 Tax=Streptomyces sp. NPDC051976 TaxID=3154947 RepID=UPI003423B7EF
MGTVRGLLPYPEPFRRRRVRAAAHRLVTCENWPDDDKTTGVDVAQLALLRLLWLQDQTRRASTGRHKEATVLLARAAVEGCLLGLYSLHVPGAVARLHAANIKAMGDILSYVVDDGLVTQSAVEQSLAAFGTKGGPPTVRQMVDQVEAAAGGAGALSLYRRFYQPTSTYFVHANAASLLRHVRPGGFLTGKPTIPWARRSAVRISDACVGILAAALARHAGTDPTEFETYAQAHAARAITPLAVVAGRGGWSALKLAELPAARKRALELRSYAVSEQALLDTPAVRKAHVDKELAPHHGPPRRQLVRTRHGRTDQQHPHPRPCDLPPHPSPEP